MAYKILTISDIHYSSKKDNKKLLRILNFIKNNANYYDDIFIVGDIIDCTNVLRKNNQEKDTLYSFFKELGSVTRTYITSGNHDISYYDKSTKEKYFNDYETYKSKFVNRINLFPGIKIIENETIKLNKKNYTLSSIVLPFEDVFLLPTNISDVLKRLKNNLNHLRNLNPNDENLLICHYPEVILGLKDSKELENINLSIAGHTHSGLTQIYLLELFLNLINQKNRGLITPSKIFFLQSDEKTRYLRGTVNLSDDKILLINKAITTLSSLSGKISCLDFCFYKGISEIIFDENTKTRKILTRKI